MNKRVKVTMAMIISCIALMGGALCVYAAGVLSIAVSSGSVAVGDSLTVTIYANGADNSEVTADMKITYDSSMLEYVSSTQSGAAGGGGSVTVSASTADLKFIAIGAGDARIKAEGAAVTAAGTLVKVSGAAGDVVDLAKSGDNSLSSLSISPGSLSPAFKGNTTKYTAAVGSDVSEIKVSPTTANSKAKVESITGNTGLKDGDNIINILVKAENGTTAAYTIAVKKGGAAAAEDDKIQDAKTEDTTTVTDDTAAVPDASTGGAITIDGVNYSVSQEFDKSEIPDRFVESVIEYGGTSYPGAAYDKGQIGMLYLVSESGDQKGFFVYDASKNSFYPFVQLKTGDRFIIPMMNPSGSVPPENYTETVLTIPEYGTIQAFKYSGKISEEKIVDESLNSTETADDPEAPAGMAAGSGFYLFFAIDEEGGTDWYQYDSVQQTYQRLNTENAAVSDGEDTYNTLLEAYNQLSDRHKATKTRDRMIIAIMIFVSAILLIVIINMILRNHGGMDDGDGDDRDEIPQKRQHKKQIPTERPKKEISKKERPKRGRVPREPAENDFYDDDDDEAFSEFEDEPHLLTRPKPKRTERMKEQKEPAVKQKEQAVKQKEQAVKQKEQAVKQKEQAVKQKEQAVKQKEPENKSEDDDIEFLDL